MSNVIMSGATDPLMQAAARAERIRPISPAALHEAQRYVQQYVDSLETNPHGVTAHQAAESVLAEFAEAIHRSGHYEHL